MDSWKSIWAPAETESEGLRERDVKIRVCSER